MKTLQGKKFAVLVAGGFEEKGFLAVQKAMLARGATLKIVSTDKNLVNGWDGQGWGHNFPVDAPLNTSLGIDYDGVIVPGGHRSHDRLNATAHTKRFLSSFTATGRFVVAMDDAASLLAACGLVEGQVIAGPDSARAPVEKAGGSWSADGFAISGPVVSGACNDENCTAFATRVVEALTKMADGGAADDYASAA